jgi:5-methyltetrahydrofolate--homocysteine methyltransferase
MNTEDLRAAMQTRLLVLDGAMGTELQRAGLPPGACGELWNLERPEIVLAIHERYRTAGADILVTNTFGGSPALLARHGLGDRAAEIALAAAGIAREAAGVRGFVLGDIGPFGGLLKPLGNADPADVRRGFAEQARALVEGGVDGILVETMSAVEEMQLAVAAAREAGASLVFASFAFAHHKSGTPRTMMGVTPEAACAAMRTAAVDAVGANCGTDLTAQDWLAIVRAYRARTDRPLLVEPNAGRPTLSPDGTRYLETPAELASRIDDLIEAGATLVGGCCGTTPDHVAVIAARQRR